MGGSGTRRREKQPKKSLSDTTVSKCGFCFFTEKADKNRAKAAYYDEMKMVALGSPYLQQAREMDALATRHKKCECVLPPEKRFEAFPRVIKEKRLDDFNGDTTDGDTP